MLKSSLYSQFRPLVRTQAVELGGEEEHAATIRCDHAADKIDQRALSCAVRAYESFDLAAAYRKRGAVDGANAAKAAGHVFDPQQCCLVRVLHRNRRRIRRSRQINLHTTWQEALE